MTRSYANIVAMLMLAVVSTSAWAHTVARSAATWTVSGKDVHLEYRVPMEESVRLVSADANPSKVETSLRAYLGDKWAVRADGELCSQDSAPVVSAGENLSATYDTWFRCKSAGSLLLATAAFFDVSPSHTILARIFKDGTLRQEFAFTSAARTRLVSLATERRADWLSAVGMFLWVGIQHIMTGPDHLAFLVGVALTASSLRTLLLLTTGFTLGHSVTLALASTERIAPKASVVEGLVAFTILLVAVDVLRSRTKASVWSISTCCSVLAVAYAAGPHIDLGESLCLYGGLGLIVVAFLRLRASTTCAQLPLQLGATTMFGLVHGMAFASGLQELAVRGSSIVPPLFGFNLGIELGQLAFIGCVVVAGWVASRIVDARYLETGVNISAVTLSCAAAWWFVTRMAGA